MANVLEFALGLESSNFLREIGVSSRELLSFAAMAEGVNYAIEKMGSAIERGASLSDLSARTGETVGNLYQLEEAFIRAGLGAESVGPMILKIQKALSGVNEMGGNTDSIFASLGLDRNKLASESPIDVIQQITAAIANLNPNDAAGAAGGLLGRGSAGDVIQLAANAEDVATAFAHSKAEAALFARNAKAFDEVGDKLGEIKSHIEGFWAGLASGLAPEIKHIEDQINAIQFTKIGEGIAESFKRGKVAELLQASIEAAFEQGGYYGERVFESMAVSVGDMFSAALLAAFQDIVPAFFDTIKLGAKLKLGEIGQNLNYQYAQEHYAAAKNAKTPDEAAKENSIGNQYVIAAQNAGYHMEALVAAHEVTAHNHILHAVATFRDGFLMAGKDVMAKLKASPDRPHEKLDSLESMMKGLAPHPFYDFLANYKSPNNGGLGHGKEKLKPEVSDLEKIGFVFGSGANGNDAAQRTLAVTQKIADKHDITNSLLNILTHKDFGALVNS